MPIFRAALFVAACAPFALQAQNFLEPLVLRASRSGQDLHNSPYTSSSLDMDELTETGRRTLPEALQFTPGVLVQKTAHGHGSPYIRGFTGRQNLLLVDGVRINNSVFRSGPVQYWNTVDPLSISRLELIKSQGSVLYGSDAIGGTLNAVTHDLSYRGEASRELYHHGSAYYQFRSNGRGSHIGRLEAEIGQGELFGVRLGYSAKEFGDIRDSAVGLMRGTGYPEQAYDLKAEYATGPDSALTFGHYGLAQQDVSRWHRTRHNPGWNHGSHSVPAGKWIANDYDQERTLTYLRYGGGDFQSDAAIGHWSATLSYKTSQEKEFQFRDTGSRPIRGSQIDADTLGFDLQLESKLGPGRLVYGFDIYHDWVDSSGYQTNLANSNRRENLPVADDSEYLLAGLFGEYRWEASDALEVTAGVRHTYAKATLGRYTDSAGVTQRNDSDHWNATVGSLRALVRISPTWSLYGGISQAFRAPNLDDLSGNLTAKANTTSFGSADLSPEKFMTWELGTRYTTETTSFGLAVFHTETDDLIVGVPTALGSTTSVAANAASGYSQGVELEGAWQFHPQWLLSGFAAWQEGRTMTEDFLGGPMSKKPNSRQLPLNGSLALRWTAPEAKVWVEGRVTAAATEDRVTAADQFSDRQRIPTNGTPSYVVCSLHTGWQPRPGTELTFTVENLTDQDYRLHGSGQNESGFQGIFGIRQSW